MLTPHLKTAITGTSSLPKYQARVDFETEDLGELILSNPTLMLLLLIFLASSKEVADVVLHKAEELEPMPWAAEFYGALAHWLAHDPDTETTKETTR